MPFCISLQPGWWDLWPKCLHCHKEPPRWQVQSKQWLSWRRTAAAVCVNLNEHLVRWCKPNLLSTEESRRATTVSNHLTVDTDGLPVRETKLSASPGTQTLKEEEQLANWDLKCKTETNYDLPRNTWSREKCKKRTRDVCDLSWEIRFELQESNWGFIPSHHWQEGG